MDGEGHHGPLAGCSPWGCDQRWGLVPPGPNQSQFWGFANGKGLGGRRPLGLSWRSWLSSLCFPSLLGPCWTATVTTVWPGPWGTEQPSWGGRSTPASPVERQQEQQPASKVTRAGEGRRCHPPETRDSRGSRLGTSFGTRMKQILEERKGGDFLEAEVSVDLEKADNKEADGCWAQWHTLVIPPLRRLIQGDHTVVKVSLSNLVKPVSKV